ncbi:uncharacterized protein LOC112041226 [Lingula anatina]|uniref:Uncharacterized protein LOC106155573 n=1 Tax=Lingula anatina TaxID=7574 RepID=A0A1S3HIT6_LINAN|nr:uncharacterized protein LOC106155573 [Lingula anatina]XP_013385922.1 uncharacterized protein LOC106155573 [Lingula anatina]XP_023930817.1 uncharacterized protein LOC112041226 [Lingula anatina]XP_023930818.1 uncharacterized protein LOC112041226 [Lingula anatina]|eukprot:XP_013385921.1 uncharacterized protein LOC106155573 [Lingula anatina]
MFTIAMHKGILTFLVFVGLVSLLDAFPAALQRDARAGFRSHDPGYGHNFGKRKAWLETMRNRLLNTRESESPLMTNEELADLLNESSQIADVFVDRIVDTNRDGVVTRQELRSKHLISQL